MKKKLLITFASIIALASTSCGNSGEDVQFIMDNTFQEGFICTPASGIDIPGFRPTVPDDRWQSNVNLTYKDDASPSWLMGQYGDIYSLNDKYNKYVGGKPEYKDGYYTFSDESKIVSVNPTNGSLYLELDTSVEYLRPREDGEAWCHILLQSGFENPICMKEIDSLTLTIDLELKKFVDYMGDDFDPDKHACQYLMYLVMNSEATLDANDYFWFGIRFFDNRYPLGLPTFEIIDSGFAGATNKYIYNLPSGDFIEDGMIALGKKTSINVDLKEYIGYALKMAQKKGYFTNSTLDDLSTQSMNIGYEIPGTYCCGIEMSNFNLIGHYPNGYNK